MSSKKNVKKPTLTPYIWEYGKMREVDRALYMLLQVCYELKLYSEPAFHHGTTCESKLIQPIEET